MAVAFTKPTDLKRNRGYAGPLRVAVLDATFSGSYATGGEAVTPSQVGMNQIFAVLGSVKEAAGATSARPVYWNNATGKLQLYGAAVGLAGETELAAGAYNAAVSGRLTVIGV